MGQIPEQDPLPEGFYKWSAEKQEEYIKEDLGMEEIVEAICYHAEIEMNLFQNGSPTLEQMEWALRLALSVGER